MYFIRLNILYIHFLCFLLPDNFPPVLNGSTAFRVTTGQSALYSFTATDSGSVTVVPAVQGLASNIYTFSTDNNTYSFSLTLMEPTNISVSFIATDDMNAVSTISPRVEICACQNEGVCTLDGILAADTSSVDMRCECPEGKLLCIYVCVNTIIMVMSPYIRTKYKHTVCHVTGNIYSPVQSS